MIPSIQLLMWLILLCALGLSGFWFFQVGATPGATVALAGSVTLYLFAMIASAYVSMRRASKPPASE